MEVTEIRIDRLIDNSRLKAYVSISLDNELAIHNIRIVENDGKFIVSMPSRRGKDGDYLDFVHPVNQEFRNKLTDMIINKYNETIGK